MELSNEHVRLVPLTGDATDELWKVAQDPCVWAISPEPFGRSPQDLAAYLDRAIAEGEAGRALPFAVIDRDSDRIVGTTRLADIERPHRKAQLGYTWYAPEVWGSAINPSCKLLLLTCAFETLGLGRVYFRINATNERSIRAVQRLGAVQEGVLRRDLLLPNGDWRDTVVLSILEEEWPSVKDGLLERLAALA